MIVVLIVGSSTSRCNTNRNMELVKMNNRHEDKKRFTICLDALQISLKKITDDALYLTFLKRALSKKIPSLGSD